MFITPVVREQPLHLEPVTPDPFIVGLAAADRPRTGRATAPAGVDVTIRGSH